jgi:hypothetical protein
MIFKTALRTLTIILGSIVITGCGGGGSSSKSDSGSGSVNNSDGSSDGGVVQSMMRLTGYTIDTDLDGNSDTTYSITYDDAGRIESSQFERSAGSSSNITYIHDDQNRVISISTTSTYQGVTQSSVFESVYDENGRLIRNNYENFDSSGALTRSGYYLLTHTDNTPNTLERHVTLASQGGDVGDIIENTFTYFINESGLPDTIINDIYTVDFRWTDSGRLEFISFSTSVYTSSFDESEYFFNSDGLVDKVVTLGTPNYTTTYTYNDAGWRTMSEKDLDSDGQVDERTVYTYENESCIVSWGWSSPGYFGDPGYTLAQAYHPSFLPGTGFGAYCLLPEPNK